MSNRILNKLKNKFDNFLQIGIKDHSSEIEKYAIYFTNAIALLSATIALVYFNIYAFKYASSIYPIYLTFFFLTLVCLLLNHYGFRRLASLYMLSLTFAIIIFTSMLGGFGMEIHPLLIVVTFCSASILLSFRLALVYNILLFFLYMVFRNYSTETGPWLDKPIMDNRHYVNFGFVFLSAFVVSRLVFNNVLKYVNNQQIALKEAKSYIEQIERQNKRLEMFNTIAAHDLRTPTRHVVSFSGLIKQKINSGNTKAKIEKYIDIISTAGYRMNELIDSISILNSIGEHNKKAVNPINLSLLITQIESEIYGKNENVKVIQSDLPTLNFREVHLDLIFKNLMNNAVKFNINKQKIIQISSFTSSNYLYICINDNGIGIEDQFKDLIFQPFKKLHINTIYDGVGLGLYVVSDILTYYNGEITFSKNDTEGSKFTIKLPKALIVN